jgi:hypothetical protein
MNILYQQLVKIREDIGEILEHDCSETEERVLSIIEYINDIINEQIRP